MCETRRKFRNVPETTKQKVKSKKSSVKPSSEETRGLLLVHATLYVRSLYRGMRLHTGLSSTFGMTEGQCLAVHKPGVRTYVLRRRIVSTAVMARLLQRLFPSSLKTIIPFVSVHTACYKRVVDVCAV